MRLDEKEARKKKEYLRGYEKTVRRMERSKLRLQEVQMSRICPAIIKDGMPHAHTPSDLSSYAVVLNRAEEELQESEIRCAEKYKEIRDRIEELEDENEKKVLTYRYLALLKWIDIREKMGYSRQHVYRVHERALKNFKDVT